MIRAFVLLAPLVLTAAGCSFNPHEVGKEPALTPIGAGLRPATVPIESDRMPRASYRPGNSIWQDTNADFYRDPRATHVGDLVTVKISIKDKATLDNSSNRSRKSNGDLDANFSYEINTAAKTQHLQAKGSGSFKPSVTAETKTDSQGAIERSESINLLVAAVVTDVLPNGNLLISGTQEVRVNYEVRVLTVAGIVRPRDISTDNSVSYDKIAEARISYGGRGRITEIQQPAWGQQIIDAIAPY
jgi:flagellar L-ring protein precursor FlgH